AGAEDLTPARLAALQSELEPLDMAAGYRALRDVGYDHGPAFRGVRALWAGPREALGEVALAAGAEEPGVLAHPALLDSSFQVVVGVSGLRGEVDRAVLWLPLGWERLWLLKRLPERLWCYARQADGAESGKTRRADLFLYGMDGKALGGVAGLELRRARRAAVFGLRADELLHEVQWREGPSVGVHSADFLGDPEEVAAGLRPLNAYLEEEGLRHAEFEAAGRELEREAQRLVLESFRELGWERRAEGRFQAEELRRRLGVTEDHRRLFGRLLALLADAGEVSRVSSGSWVDHGGATGTPPEGSGAAAGKAGSVELALLHRCGASLAAVLRGRADPLELLFGGELGAADLYRESKVGSAVNRLVADAVSEAVSGLPGGRQLKVLEVGAGTGATTALVLPVLPAGQTEYGFTDISAGFLGPAEERFGNCGREMRYQVLDIERDPEAQGLRSHEYDLVIAANVLHATRDLRESLAHCRRLLAPSGLLVAVEGMAPQGWLDLTFGLLPGWWRFEDEFRPDYALAGSEVWRQALRDTGYGAATLMGADLGQAVILARAPEAPESRGMFVLAGGGAFAETLEAELAARRQTVTRGPADGDREAWSSFFRSLPEDVPLRGVAHLAAVRGDGSGLTTGELEREVELVGSSALSLVQGMTDAGVRPSAGTWFVSRGGQVVEREPAGTLSGSLLWGFGSVVDLEYGDLKARALDLDPGTAPEAAELADELLFPDRETRIARRAGGRFVARLTALSALAGAEQRPRADRSYLVTGGLGGIGLEVAGWLAASGAGAIVLNGRRAPDERAAETVERLRAGGAAVRVEIADVTDVEAVEGMLRRTEAELPPLGGVIHSVGVLADGALTNQDWGRFEEVLGPKVLGAWRLHRATLDRELDLFVLFSSVTGVLGNAGQANHAAANAFLDQLARHRRSLGLPGQAIAWGAWSEVGEAAERRAELARLSASDMDWVTPEQGIEALDHLVRANVENAMVAPMDWSVLAADTAGMAPFLSELVVGEAREPLRGGGDFVGRLRSAPVAERERLAVEFVQEEVRAVLRLGAPPPAQTGFFDLGVDSVMAVQLGSRLNRALDGVYVAPNTVVFDYPTPAQLGRHLLEQVAEIGKERPALRVAPRLAARADERVAVVGMACRFPGGPDAASFWARLEAGEQAVTPGRPEELVPGGRAGGAGPFGAYLTGLDRFDAEFFRIAPVEAEFMDPQHRLLLEVSWEALEDAGLDPGGLRGSRTGVWVGIMNADYARLISPREKAAEIFYLSTGTGAAAASGRVAFALGLKGPAIAVDTACSSSLVTIHQAAVALQHGEVDLALAGGVNATLIPHLTRLYEHANMLSRDGCCRTFDARANGYVRGEGCGMLVLKRLPEAERDGDRILGVLLGSAVN
ncbi:MAG: SDR family NAD(P)-dependent oxidoreductase, partial [Gemmatimonadetes bacterium]|nr:SDR family NAD(P)-dependent oxidoreductase [Gemmatimonadota bacterium]